MTIISFKIGAPAIAYAKKYFLKILLKKSSSKARETYVCVSLLWKRIISINYYDSFKTEIILNKIKGL